MKKRLLSILLVLAMCAALLPTIALAEGEAVTEVWTAAELSAAIQDGASSIKLMQDITLDSGLTITGALTLDLAGCKLTFNEAAGTAIDVGSNTLTLEDSSAEQTGELVVLCDTGIYINRGKLVLNGGTILADGKTALSANGDKIQGGSEIHANGGVVYGAVRVGMKSAIKGAGGTVFEGNVELLEVHGPGRIQAGIYKGTVTFRGAAPNIITGGTFYGNVNYTGSDGDTAITGGTFFSGVTGTGFASTPTTITLYLGNGETKTGHVVGNKLSRPEDPTRPDDTFLGWYCNGKKWDFEEDTIPEGTQEIKLQAKWKSEADGEGFVIGGLLSGLLESAASALEETFVDVSRGAYYYNAVEWAAERGIAGGVDAKHFAPDESCTRAQAVTMMWRAAGCPEVWTENPFEDVDADDYYYEAVLWAVANGITSGADETHFSPDAPCTRGQIVTFLHRAERCYGAHDDFGFTDVKTGSYCEDAINWAVENAITNGTDVETFSPDETCTRAQIVTFLYRNR